MCQIRLASLLVCSLVFTPALSEADDWLNWRGPDRAGISYETGLLKSWPEGGPKKLWTASNSGMGYSGFSVRGEMLYTMGSEGQTEYLICFNSKTGEKLWATPAGSTLKNGWGDGPRCTPTIDGEMVYGLSGEGILIAVNAQSGDESWQVDIKSFGGEIPQWGYTESPLVEGTKVVVTPGGDQGAMVALDKMTGETIWQSTDFKQPAQYSSIVAADINGKHVYVQLTAKELVGIDSQSGQVVWSSPWKGKTAVIPTPIVNGNDIYIASGYGVGCKMVHVDENNNVTDVYDNQNMKNHHGGVILVGDYLYGYSDGRGWLCQDFKTGEVVWYERNADYSLNKGAVSCADGMLYLQEENTGTIVLIEASSEGWKEHGRFVMDPQSEQRSPKGKIWTHPVIANGKLYVRDQEFLNCYDISAN